MAHSLYWLKKNLPSPILSYAQKLKLFCWNLFHKQCSSVSLDEQFPWCSPNVWERIVDFYNNRQSPVIFEYGTGASSIHHIRNLLTMGGTYIGVEHKPDWYAHVLHAILRYGIQHNLTIESSGEPAAVPHDFPVHAYDAVFRLTGGNVTGCTVILKLRPPYNRKEDADGTLAEFREYVYALSYPCDVVIVDGRARKACINYTLDNNLIKPGGLLVLFEAGRGVDGWLGWPALSGSSDYQPEVRRILALGGILVDGCGLDRWQGLKNRRTPNSNAFCYPMEACFLTIPSEKSNVK